MRFYKLCVDGTNSFFTYCDENDEYKIGDRVAVNFRGKEHGALIVEPENKNEFEFKVLPIKRKLANEISLDETYMKMLLWVRNYYMCKFEQILKAAIPSDLKVKYDEVYKLTEMAKRIITISREFGSGGRFIGEEVAKKLGIAYYDKNIIGQIAEKSGLSPEYIQENAELSPKKGLFAYAFSGRDITGKSVEDMVYEVQRNIILELAEKEPCVIIGRNADYILKDRDDVLNVFIHGDMPEKIKRITGLYNVKEKEAVKMMADTDKRRRTNYNFYTDQNWGKASNYTLCLNSSQLGYDRCEMIIMECVK